MTYTSIDHPEHFVFMDTTWELLRREGRDLTFRIEDLCVSKDEPNNPESCDLQTEEAIATFRNFELLRAETAECTETDAEGNTLSVTPGNVFEGDVGMDLLTSEAVFVVDFYHVDSQWSIEALGADAFVAAFRFSSVQIEWDGHCGTAWYEA